MVRVETSYIYNVKTISRDTKQVKNTKDKFIGNNKCLLEKSREEYFKEDFKL